MNTDLKTLIKILRLEKREDLVDILKRSHTFIRSSNQFGSVWNSFLSTFVFYCPVEDYRKAKNLTNEEKEYLLKTIREIYPPEEDGPDITEINFRILQEESDENDKELTQEKDLLKSEEIRETKRTIRVFLSYSSDDGIIAGKIKHYLFHTTLKAQNTQIKKLVLLTFWAKKSYRFQLSRV